MEKPENSNVCLFCLILIHGGLKSGDALILIVAEEIENCLILCKVASTRKPVIYDLIVKIILHCWQKVIVIYAFDGPFCHKANCSYRY